MSPAISPVAPSPTLPLSSRRPSVSFGGFGFRGKLKTEGTEANARPVKRPQYEPLPPRMRLVTQKMAVKKAVTGTATIMATMKGSIWARPSSHSKSPKSAGSNDPARTIACAAIPWAA